MLLFFKKSSPGGWRPEAVPSFASRSYGTFGPV